MRVKPGSEGRLFPPPRRALGDCAAGAQSRARIPGAPWHGGAQRLGMVAHFWCSPAAGKLAPARVNLVYWRLRLLNCQGLESWEASMAVTTLLVRSAALLGAGCGGNFSDPSAGACELPTAVPVRSPGPGGLTDVPMAGWHSVTRPFLEFSLGLQRGCAQSPGHKCGQLWGVVLAPAWGCVARWGHLPMGLSWFDKPTHGLSPRWWQEEVEVPETAAQPPRNGSWGATTRTGWVLCRVS